MNHGSYQMVLELALLEQSPTPRPGGSSAEVSEELR